MIIVFLGVSIIVGRIAYQIVDTQNNIKRVCVDNRATYLQILTSYELTLSDYRSRDIDAFQQNSTDLVSYFATFHSQLKDLFEITDFENEYPKAAEWLLELSENISENGTMKIENFDFDFHDQCNTILQQSRSSSFERILQNLEIKVTSIPII